MKTEKEFLYVGHYIDVDGNFVLKVGTTDDLKRRQKEHNTYYAHKAKKCRMAKNSSFEYDWHLPLSKYNTLRFEDRTKAAWKNLEIGKYINNDRFILAEVPEFVEITIKKTYKIKLAQASFFVYFDEKIFSKNY